MLQFELVILEKKRFKTAGAMIIAVGVGGQELFAVILTS